MIKHLFVGFLLFTTQLSIAQKEGNNWRLGWFEGVDFSSGNPVAVHGDSIMAYEGCATISDKAGNLLFYTDGVTVWDRHDHPTPNTRSWGLRLGGSIYSTQSVAVVPHPDSSYLYYLFTTFSGGDTAKLRYSVFDMRLNNGMGDVTGVKNIPLMDPTCEKIAVAKHANGHDYWVVTHQWMSDAFYTYKVTSAGLDTIPMITHLGDSLVSDGDTYNQKVKGYMRISIDGKKLVMAAAPFFVHFFDFDNQIGALSNYFRWWTTDALAKITGIYGVEFSPNSRYVYVSTHIYVSAGHYPAHIHQFDLNAGSPAAVLASHTNIASGYYFGGMQMAPNHKIYVTHAQLGYAKMHVINNPNGAGATCDFQSTVFDDGAYPGNNLIDYGLPYVVGPGFEVGIVPDLSCSSTVSAFQLTNPHIDSVKWDFGDPASGTGNFSSGSNPSHQYPAFGVYSVKAIAYDIGMIDTTVIQINVAPPPSSIVLGSDTSFCQGGILVLNAPSGYSYQWSNNAITQSINVAQTGIYRVTVSNYNCSVTSAPLTVTVHAPPDTTVTKSNGTTICLDDSTILTAASGMLYHWSNNSTAQAITVKQQASYAVTLTDIHNCSAASSAIPIVVNPYTIPTITPSGNISLCQGAELTINTYPATGVTYHWSNNVPYRIIHVSVSGTYTVTVTNSYGCTAQSEAAVVAVHPTPLVTLAGNADTLCSGTSQITLTGGSPAGGVFSGTGVAGSMFNPSAAGIGLHAVVYTYTDSYSCKDSATENIFVEMCAGIEEEKNSLKAIIYPNPVSEQLSIVIDVKIVGAKLTIYNVQGEIVETMQLQTINTQVAVDWLEAGVYIAEIGFAGNTKRIRWCKL